MKTKITTFSRTKRQERRHDTGKGRGEPKKQYSNQSSYKMKKNGGKVDQTRKINITEYKCIIKSSTAYVGDKS